MPKTISISGAQAIGGMAMNRPFSGTMYSRNPLLNPARKPHTSEMTMARPNPPTISRKLPCRCGQMSPETTHSQPSSATCQTWGRM